MKDNQLQLNNWRKEIDAIDDALIKLLAQRNDAVIKIGKYKKQYALPQLDAVRWQKVLEDKLQKANKNNISPEYIQELYELIHKYSLKLQKDL